MLASRFIASLPMLLALIGVAESIPGQRQYIERIADLLVDEDGDFLADRIGTSATVSGAVTASPYPARRGRELRIYLQDASAGIRCIATDKELLTDIKPGDQVIVDGTIEQYRGMEHLHVRSIECTGEGLVPAPITAKAGTLQSKRLLGRLVTVTAKLHPPILSAAATLEDDTGLIELYMPRSFENDQDMLRILAAGGMCQVVGYSEQNDSTMPYDAGYRLRLRSPKDIVVIPPQSYVTVTIIAAVLLLGGLGFVAVRRNPKEDPVTGHVALTPHDRVQGQKMEALGTLAGGIAHEFNNYLAAIQGYAELAQCNLEQDTETRKYLDEVLATNALAKELVDKILKFGRKADPGFENIDIAEVIGESLELLRAALPANVELKSEIDPYAGIVRAAGNQLHQVLLNLAANSADAMRKGGGTLRITVDRLQVDASQAAKLKLGAAGPFARIVVRDSGPGMDEETLQRMYDPFFTTKDVGAGTGLGLSIVHGILAAHNAGVLVSSKIGSGTTFEIFLPISTAPTPTIAEPTTAGAVPTGSERVLLVDDTERLAELGRKHLQALGYEVLIATSGAQALEVFASADPPIEAVVTDYRMPGLTGLELTEKLKQIRPEIAVLMMTGYGQLLDPAEAHAVGIHEVLNKPYARADLARALRRALADD